KLDGWTPRRSVGRINHVAGVDRARWLKAQNQCLLVGAGPMLDAMRHDHALSRPQGHDPISEFNPKPAAPNHEKFVFMFVMVPWKFALCFHVLALLHVQPRDGLRSPLFAQQCEFFLQSDFVHVRLLLACLLSHSLLHSSIWCIVRASARP